MKPKQNPLNEAIKSSQYGGLDPKRAELASAMTKVMLNDVLRQVKEVQQQQKAAQGEKA